MSVTQTAVLSAWLFLGCALGAPAAAACSDVETCSSSSSSSSSRASQENILLQTERAAEVRRVSVPTLLPEWALSPTDATEAEAESVQESVPSELGLLSEAEEELLGFSPTAKEKEHFEMVKAERRKGHTCPDGKYFPPNNNELRWDCRLSRAARKWSQRMARENFIAHRKDGSTSCTRTHAEGFPKLKACGENIAGGDGSPRGAIEQLKKSNNHCTNMYEPKYNKLGVGFASNPSSTYVDYWTDSFGEWPAGPDESCIGGYPAPTPPPGCADIDTMNCQTYKNQGYCSYSPNVQAQCKETCAIGGCGKGAPAPRPAPRPAPQPAPRPPTGGACADSDGNCNYYASQGYCSTDHIKKSCPRSCNLCGRPAPAPPSSCVDTDGACGYYANQGYCSTDHIKKSCPKSCRQC